MGDNETLDTSVPAVEESFVYGTAFEKVDEYDGYLDEKNPWHPDLAKPLFDSQIIGFRWMADRHRMGGGLICDKVGCGKVHDSILPCCIVLIQLD